MKSIFCGSLKICPNPLKTAGYHWDPKERVWQVTLLVAVLLKNNGVMWPYDDARKQQKHHKKKNQLAGLSKLKEFTCIYTPGPRPDQDQLITNCVSCATEGARLEVSKKSGRGLAALNYWSSSSPSSSSSSSLFLLSPRRASSSEKPKAVSAFWFSSPICFFLAN